MFHLERMGHRFGRVCRVRVWQGMGWGSVVGAGS